MSRETATLRGRAFAESGMVDACVVRRRTGEATDANGVVTPTWADLYTGKCRVQVHAPGARTDVGQASLIVTRTELQLPITATGLREGDVVTMTASALDPDLVGNVYTVVDVLEKTHATARRCTVTEVKS